jgi:hypothetical protein
MFANPRMRTMLPDWAEQARRLVTELRGTTTGVLTDPRFVAVVDRLRREYPQVRQWWDSHEVRPRTGLRKRFQHPVVGALDLDRVVLRPAAAPELELKILLPVAGTGTEERLRRLVASGTGA